MGTACTKVFEQKPSLGEWKQKRFSKFNGKNTGIVYREPQSRLLWPGVNSEHAYPMWVSLTLPENKWLLRLTPGEVPGHQGPRSPVP